MKRLVYGALFLTIIGIVFVGCKKESIMSDTSSVLEKELINENTQKASVFGVKIFTVKPHRKAGKTNRYGADCNCNICAGFCEFKWFPNSIYKGPEDDREPTIIFEYDTNKSAAKIYFLSEVNYDDEFNPIFYIDENIEIIEDKYSFLIKEGKYEAKNEEGEITIGEEFFSYSSYIDVLLDVIY